MDEPMNDAPYPGTPTRAGETTTTTTATTTTAVAGPAEPAAAQPAAPVTVAANLNSVLDSVDGAEVDEAIVAVEGEEMTSVPAGMCIECEDQPAERYCEQCGDEFCDLCFKAQHRRGQRAKHTTTDVVSNAAAAAMAKGKADMQEAADAAAATAAAAAAAAAELDAVGGADLDVDMEPYVEAQPAASVVPDAPGSMRDRAKFIPIRLDPHERKWLRLLEAALKVSEYTDKVDVYTYYNKKQKRIVAQLKDICAILSGLVVAYDYKAGQQLVSDRNFEDNADFFKSIFEVGRRYKIMNPEKMRDTYGKLMYLLQDSQSPEIQELLQFSCVQPVKNVYDTLADAGGLGVLDDPLIYTATMEIIPDGRPRFEIQRDIKAKEAAIERISRMHATLNLEADDIKQCLYSIGDNNAFLRGNRDPVEKMIHLLTHYFRPDTVEDGFSLAIQGGRGGARLTHNHTRQYHYVLQSLMLWREIMHDFFRLWFMAESDLLAEESPYRLTDTGQGLNRVQRCPRSSKAMHSILYSVQGRVQHWVGSSVIHLGDHNVPNALMFYDKYCQVPRILAPIVLCVEQIDGIVSDPDIAEYIDRAFGGPDVLKRTILTDFFRHAFDGSGADNFFDAGSCIDGRLTSAWNWCSKLEKKPYFPVFLLTGFSGFDGEF